MVALSFVFETDGSLISTTPIIPMPYTVPPGVWRLLKYTITGPATDNSYLNVRLVNTYGTSLTRDTLHFHNGELISNGGLALPYDEGSKSTCDFFADVPFLVNSEVEGVGLNFGEDVLIDKICLVFEIPRHNL